MFKIEMMYIYGWDDAAWHIDDKPTRYATIKEAQSDLEEYIADTESAAADGDLEEAYKIEDFRIVPVPSIDEAYELVVNAIAGHIESNICSDEYEGERQDIRIAWDEIKRHCRRE